MMLVCIRFIFQFLGLIMQHGVKVFMISFIVL